MNKKSIITIIFSLLVVTSLYAEEKRIPFIDEDGDKGQIVVFTECKQLSTKLEDIPILKSDVYEVTIIKSLKVRDYKESTLVDSMIYDLLLEYGYVYAQYFDYDNEVFIYRTSFNSYDSDTVYQICAKYIGE